MEKKINDFIIFCLQIYKNKNNLSGEEAYDIFERYQVFKYLEEGYDMLHTQGDEWLVDDINTYLEIRGFKNE